jgi:anthranilate synthase/aminodeoxychorismate synthase-like glutamine amidotransferase
VSHVLVIDNYDSFTYNLVQGLLGIGAEVTVRYSDLVSTGEAESIAPTHLVISPGPGRPEDAGASVEMIRHFSTRIPILGVCLGHQAIAVAFGGHVGSARALLHGKTSEVLHDGRGVFAGLGSPTVCGRYHSLAVTLDTLPRDLVVTAFTGDWEVMGLRHTRLPVEGVQFHPESILTPDGERMLSNFLSMPAPAPSSALTWVAA